MFDYADIEPDRIDPLAADDDTVDGEPTDL